MRQACALPFGVYPNIEDRSDIEDWTHVPRYEKTALSPEELAARMEEWHAPMVTIILPPHRTHVGVRQHAQRATHLQRMNWPPRP